MKQKIHRVLSLLLCCVMLVGLMPTTAFAWETTGHCEFCGGFIADDWICDGGEHCSADSDRSDCYQAHHCGECGKCVNDENELCSECGWCTDCGGECAAGIGSCGLCLKCHLEDWMACWECGMCFYEDEYMKCSNCGRCYDCGLECSEGKDHACLECHYEEGGMWGDQFACEDCGLCFIEAPEYMCIGECGRCYDCGGECSEGKEHACLECHYENGSELGISLACEDCGVCLIDITDGICGECGRCYDCGDGACYECDMCIECAIENGLHCPDCTNCSSEYPLCPSCGLCDECADWCDTCEMHAACAAEAELHCPDCLKCGEGEVILCDCGLCEECGDAWCENCEQHIECHTDYICVDCGECFADDDTGCEHCRDCIESEGYACDECGVCYVCEGIDLCENCGTANGVCFDCAMDNGYHCPECGNCYDEVDQCDDGEDHCQDCCLICEECGECFLGDEMNVCDDCELCLDCCDQVREDAGCTCEDAPCVQSADWDEHWADKHAGEEHTHVYPSGYQRDKVQHWKECLVCGDVSETAEDHDFGSWSDTLTGYGSYFKLRTCSTCGYRETCKHKADEIDWQPTSDGEFHEYECGNCGFYIKLGHSYVADEEKGCHVCSQCGQEEAHDYGEWKTTIINDPFIGRVYQSTRTCKTCGAKNMCSSLAKDVEWTRIDENSHRFECEKCGASFEKAHIADTTYYTGDETGHWHVCSICEGKMEVLPHVAKLVNKKSATMTDVGYTGDKVCRLCGEFMERGSVIPALGYGHEHQFSDEWSSGGGMHWHECTVDGCSAKEGLEAHDSSDWELVTPATEETDGLKKRVCKTCGFVDEEIIPKGHAHSFSRLWKSDDASHWHVCDCGAKAEEAAHTFKWVVDKEATATEKGSKHEECEVCGYKKAAVEIPATGTTKPTDPSDPTDPGQNPDSPETGDNSMMGLWAALLFVSGCGIFGATIYGKKKKEIGE